MSKSLDLTNQRRGMLTILHFTGETKYARPSKVWLCQCDCGTLKKLSVAELRQATNCGCVYRNYLSTFGHKNKGKLPSCTLPVQESNKRSHFRSYKNNAIKRNYSFELHEEEFRSLIIQNCHYCGSPPSSLKKDYHRPEGSYLSNGIDRVDNSIGYEKTNCVPCCVICNRAKDIMTVEEFKTWIKKVAKNLHLEYDSAKAAI
jgi:hypothetical protein